MGTPNILWICTDQQRYDTLGCYGNDHVSTLTLDGLASEGVRFERCFAQNPVCSPSRASFLTGRYPRTTGVRRNGQDIPRDEVLVTRLLSEAGYTCGLAGKLHVSSCFPDQPRYRNRERRIHDGYAEFHWSHDPADFWPTNEYRHWLDRQGVEFERTPVDGSDHVSTSVPSEYHQATWCVDRAIDFIRANEDRSQPWLFSVNPFDPHQPFDPPASYLEPYRENLDAVPLPNFDPAELEEKTALATLRDNQRFQSDWYPTMDDNDHRLVRAAYWAMCDHLDDQVERLLTCLDRTDQRDETVVIYMSDHGEMLGDHGVYRKGAYMYEPAVRLPLIVAGPGIESNIAAEGLVELGDIAPTLLEAAGESVPDRMQTRSLWPILTGDRAPDDHRADVYCEHYASMAGADPAISHGTMLRTDSYRLIRWHELDDGELYDLDADPDECHDRWDDPEYAGVKQRLLARLSDRMYETIDPLPERRAPW